MAKEYTMDDPEFYILLAKTLGNDVGSEIEDDSQFVDENGVVIDGGQPEQDVEPEQL